MVLLNGCDGPPEFMVQKFQIRWGWRHHGEDQQLANHQVKQVGCVWMGGWFHYLMIGCHLKRSRKWSKLVGLQSGSESRRNGMVKWVATHCLIWTISMVSISDYFASRYLTSLPSFNHLSLNSFDGLTFRFPFLLPAVGFEFWFDNCSWQVLLDAAEEAGLNRHEAQKACSFVIETTCGC